LLVGAGVGDGVAYAAEDVDFVGEVAAQRERVSGACLSRRIPRRVDGNLTAGGAGLRGKRREPRRAGDAGLCARLLEARERSFQGLIGGDDLRLERIEIGITECRPPATACARIGGGGDLPVARLLVARWWLRGRGPLIVRGERAA